MNNKFSFSEDELKQAAEIVNNAMLQAVPEPEECNANFSPEFDTKMSRIFAKNKRRLHTRKLVHSVCAAAASFVLIVGIWLATDVDARAGVLNWVRETYRGNILYKFDEKVPDYKLPTYILGWIPEGFTETSRYTDEKMQSFNYENKETGQNFMFYYFVIEEGIQSQISGFEKSEPIEINNNHGEYFYDHNEPERKHLIWVSNDEKTVFEIDGNIEKTDILLIANSICSEDLTN